jgi:hypothetical protein
LIFHLVENPYDVRVPEGTMSRVIEWTKNFIIPSYRHTYGQSGASRDIEIEICLMEHIVQQADTKDTITIRDLPMLKLSKLVICSII